MRDRGAWVAGGVATVLSMSIDLVPRSLHLMPRAVETPSGHASS